MSQPKIKLRVFRGSGQSEEMDFAQKRILIGKLASANLRLDDESVSREHAVIEVLDSGEIKITDLESTNGTKLNGAVIVSSPLKS
ncbi:MAG: FHA domain-containing protein, partial [Deltaproteobacteria bacterium]|nr:FHA domain-containing protein [Deltaproteobacteria bacterium]